MDPIWRQLHVDVHIQPEKVTKSYVKIWKHYFKLINTKMHISMFLEQRELQLVPTHTEGPTHVHTQLQSTIFLVY